jgi:tetratricopeptide (TPR) repeat protein
VLDVFEVAMDFEDSVPPVEELFTFPSLENLQSHDVTDAEAKGLFAKALAIREAMAADSPTAEYRVALADCHERFADLLFSLKENSEASLQYQRGLTIRESLCQDVPSVPKLRIELARAYMSVGLRLRRRGQVAEARGRFEQAFAIQEELIADFPTTAHYRIDLARRCFSMGYLLYKDKDYNQSHTIYQRAIDNLQQVKKQEPDNEDARLYLPYCHAGRAKSLDRLERYADAVNDWTLAIELSPPNEQKEFRARRATSRTQAGMVAEAVAEVAELTKSPKWDRGQWYDFACIYSIASAKFADKKAEYADAAVGFLRQSVNAGWKDAAHMKQDTDLDPLRDRDDFKKLLADLEAKFPPKKETLPPPRADK